MARKNIKTVDMENPIYEKIIKGANETNISIHKFINELVEQALAKNEFIKTIVPRFSVIEFSEDSIIIKDEKSKQTRIVIITIQNGKLFCDVHGKNDCEHIHYVLMLPQLAKIKDKLKMV